MKCFKIKCLQNQFLEICTSINIFFLYSLNCYIFLYHKKIFFYCKAICNIYFNYLLNNPLIIFYIIDVMYLHLMLDIDIKIIVYKYIFN